MEIDVSPELGIYRLLESYPYTLALALSEYIDNAIQANMDAEEQFRRKKIKIEISCNLKDKENQSITIRDNAVGISANNLSHVLKPAKPPMKKHLSEFGIGMKAASIWLGEKWTLTSYPVEGQNAYSVIFDLEDILASQKSMLSVKQWKTEVEERGVEINISKLRDITAEAFKEACTALHDTYQIFIYREKSLELSFSLDGISDDLNDQEERKAPKPLKYPKAIFKSTAWGKLAFRIGSEELWDFEDLKFDFDNIEIKGRILVRETASQANNPGVAMFRHKRLIQGSRQKPYRPSSLLGTQNKDAPSRVYIELHLDGMQIDNIKGKFNFDESRFLKVLGAQQQVKDCIRQAEAYRPTYEGKDSVIPFSNEIDMDNYLKKKKEEYDCSKRTSKNKGKGKSGNEHNQNWKNLLQEISPSSILNPKTKALIDEAMRLELSYPYAASLLLRTLLELLMKDYLKNLKLNKKMKDSLEIKGNKEPVLNDMLTWFIKPEVVKDIFPEDDLKTCKLGLQKFSKNKKILNGITHEYDLVSREKLKPIVEDLFQLIKYFSEFEKKDHPKFHV